LARLGALTSKGQARLVLVAACLGGAYALGAWVSIEYQSPVIGATAFWPSAGLTLATLLLTPRRTWPLWLAAFAAAEFGVDLAHGQAAPLALGYALANGAEPLVGALLARRFVRSIEVTRGNLAGFVTCAVAAGPVVGAIIGATTTVLFLRGSEDWLTVAWVFWLGDALGVLVVGSLIMVWACRPRSDYRVPVAAILGMSAVGAGAIIVTAVVWQAPVILAALPVLVWAAFGGGSLAVMTVGAAVAVATDWAALTGRTSGLLAAASPPHDLAVLQCFLALTLLTAMVLNVEIAERRKKEDHVRRTEVAVVKVAEAERRSISQETHDIVGHGLTAMLLQLGAARQVLASDPKHASQLLASAEAIGRGACTDLELALAILGREPTRSPGRGLAELPDLVGALSGAGLHVTLDMQAEHEHLTALVEWSAYRIAQEALTNVARHAPGAHATVTVRCTEDMLNLSVVDDGGAPGAAGSLRLGRGIIGMRERASALGGTLDAGPSPDGGFAVTARLPL
jgi:signal transduction histidine kinase